MISLLNNINSMMVSTLRYGRGNRAQIATRQGEQPLHLYEYEGCPFCRKVREVLTEMDQTYICHPCGKGSRNRDYVKTKGGQTMFPFLEDPNTGASLYESEEIITYLMETYGTGRTQSSKAFSPLNTLTSMVAGSLRPLLGHSVKSKAKDRQSPEDMLILYNREFSPYCRKVREVFVELDLTYECRNVGVGSPRRNDLKEFGGQQTVPYLIDPNNDVAMYESNDIIKHLNKEYSS